MNIGNKSQSLDLKASLSFHKVNQSIQHIIDSQIKKNWTLTASQKNPSYPLPGISFPCPNISRILTSITVNSSCLFLNFTWMVTIWWAIIYIWLLSLGLILLILSSSLFLYLAKVCPLLHYMDISHFTVQLIDIFDDALRVKIFLLL